SGTSRISASSRPSSPATSESMTAGRPTGDDRSMWCRTGLPVRRCLRTRDLGILDFLPLRDLDNLDTGVGCVLGANRCGANDRVHGDMRGRLETCRPPVAEGSVVVMATGRDVRDLAHARSLPKFCANANLCFGPGLGWSMSCKVQTHEWVDT